jgi:hypothetical protein
MTELQTINNYSERIITGVREYSAKGYSPRGIAVELGINNIDSFIHDIHNNKTIADAFNLGRTEFNNKVTDSIDTKILELDESDMDLKELCEAKRSMDIDELIYNRFGV